MGIFFSILSPVIGGVNNYIDKILLAKYNISPTVITIYGGIYGFLAGIFVLLITGFYPIDLKSLIIILSSGFLTTIYLLPYYKALSLDEVSYVIPLFQLYPIFVLALSFIIFSESLSWIQYVGCFFIIIGGFLISVEKLNNNIFKLRRANFYMLLSCFLFAVAQVLYKFGIREVPFWNSLPYEGFGISLGALLIVFFRNNFRKFKNETNKFKRKMYVLMTLNEVVYLFARYTGYFAISLISVGIVSVLSGLQPVFVLIYGIVLSLWFPKIIKEAISKNVLIQKVMSIALMFIGLYFIFY